MPSDSVNILLIDDHIKYSTLLKETLEYHNFNVNLFNCSASAFEFAKNNKPDIVICDIYMPEMNGYEFHAAFKDLEYWEVPFLFLSAKNLDEDIRKGMNLGADDYLTKPVKTPDLLESIKSQLKKKEKMLNEFRLMEISLRTRIAEKDETLKREATVLSHTIREPLSTLMAVVNVLEDDRYSERKSELIKGIKPLAEKLDRAIRENVQNINVSTS